MTKIYQGIKFKLRALNPKAKYKVRYTYTKTQTLNVTNNEQHMINKLSYSKKIYIKRKNLSYVKG